MSINPPFLQQEVVSDNEQIFQRIKSSLENAKEEILIASAWFTDDDLFYVLLRKLDESVKVDVAVADIQANERLPFHQLVQKGASFVRVKNVGSGIMNQKFCVIDKKMAIHGSYNYTHNAKKNNDESVIMTNHIETVNSLIETFARIKAGDDNIISLKAPGDQKEEELEKKYVEQVKELLDKILSGELSDFDRDELHKNGYDRSESCSGDYNVLPNCLDTVYYNFINNVNITEEKKARLLIKIAELRAQQVQAADAEMNSKNTRRQLEFNARKESLQRQISDYKIEGEIIDKKIENIQKQDIVAVQNVINDIRERINEAKRIFIKPQHKLFEIIPISLLVFALLTYLILFYSSAAYILLFSEVDVMKSIKSGIEVSSHEVFEPNAIKLAFERGWVSVLYIFFFVVLPMSLALADRYVKNKKMIVFMSFILGVFLFDSFLAFKVSKSLYEIKRLTEGVAEEWNFSMILHDINFYLVFVLGATGLLIFKYVFKKFISLFEERSPDINTQKNLLLIEQYKQKIQEKETEKLKLEKGIEVMEVNKLQLNERGEQLGRDIENMPIVNALAGERDELELAQRKQYVDHICSLYSQKIENNNPPISLDGLRDRMNLFLGGWNDFLHAFFAVSIAVEKSSKASAVASSWLSEKIDKRILDTRLKS